MSRPLTPEQRGQLIAAAREAKGWTQVQLAAVVGVRPSTVNKIEHGELSGSVDTVIALGTALDMDLNSLKGAALEEEATSP